MKKRNSGNTSIIIGASILALITLGLIGVGYSFYTNETAEEESDSSEIVEENNPYENLKKEKNFVTTPVTERESSGVGRLELEEGIPTGTYSNPPTTVNSFDESDITTDRPINSPINNYGSSVESNRLSQERFSSQTPNYSRPSSSNNFDNSNSENSLIEPLEDDDFLDVPGTNPSEDVETPSLFNSDL